MLDFPGVFLSVSEDIRFRLQLDLEMVFVGNLFFRDDLFAIYVVYDSHFSFHAYIITRKMKKENVFFDFFLTCAFPLKYHTHACAYEKIPTGA